MPLTEKEIQQAYNLLGEHSRFCRVLNLRGDPMVEIIKSSSGPFAEVDKILYTLSLGELSMSFEEDSEFAISLRHHIKNEFHNRLQDIEHKLQVLGVEVPGREKTDESPFFSAYSRLGMDKPNWLKEDVK